MVEGDDARRARELLHERDTLCVILLLDSCAVIDRGLRLRLAEVQERVRVVRDTVLLWGFSICTACATVSQSRWQCEEPTSIQTIEAAAESRNTCR